MALLVAERCLGLLKAEHGPELPGQGAHKGGSGRMCSIRVPLLVLMVATKTPEDSKPAASMDKISQARAGVAKQQPPQLDQWGGLDKRGLAGRRERDRDNLKGACIPSVMVSSESARPLV